MDIIKLGRNRYAMSLIEIVVAIGMISMLFGAIYLSYFSILDVITSSELRADASALLNQEMEIIRNLSYENVGTVGGVPSGVVPVEKVVANADGQVFRI